MKIVFVVFAFAIFAVATAIPTPEFKRARRDVFADAMSCARSLIHLSGSTRLKCVEKCTMEKQGIWSDSTGLDVDTVTSKDTAAGLNYSDAKAMAEKCAYSKNDYESNCEWASRSLHCVQQEEIRLFGGK